MAPARSMWLSSPTSAPTSVRTARARGSGHMSTSALHFRRPVARRGRGEGSGGQHRQRRTHFHAGAHERTQQRVQPPLTNNARTGFPEVVAHGPPGCGGKGRILCVPHPRQAERGRLCARCVLRAHTLVLTASRAAMGIVAERLAQAPAADDWLRSKAFFAAGDPSKVQAFVNAAASFGQDVAGEMGRRMPYNCSSLARRLLRPRQRRHGLCPPCSPHAADGPERWVRWLAACWAGAVTRLLRSCRPGRCRRRARVGGEHRYHGRRGKDPRCGVRWRLLRSAWFSQRRCGRSQSERRAHIRHGRSGCGRGFLRAHPRARRQHAGGAESSTSPTRSCGLYMRARQLVGAIDFRLAMNLSVKDLLTAK
jgi:hypothetical protein